MYCKFCGKEISEDAVCCTHCGKMIDVKNKDSDEEKNEKTKKDTRKTFYIVGVFIFIIIILLGFVWVKVNSKSESTGLNVITRNLNSSDYECNTSQGLTSYKVIITPKTDIEECTIELRLYNTKDEKIFTDTITKTELKKGSSYTYNFEFGFLNSLSGNYVKYNVTGKC